MIPKKEILFQIVLLLVVLLFYSYDRDNPGVTGAQAAFFVNYALASTFIAYVLMPKFLYQKKYLAFLGSVILVIAVVILVEELVLEQLFFPNSKRASGFPGVFFTLTDVLPVIAILSGFKFGWDALQKQEQIDALKNTVQESELQFLRSQINPHFLFNNLNNLYSYALEGSPKTPEIILELSGVLRYMLYECKEKFVPFQKEVEQLHNFIKLNKLQIEHRGSINFEVGEVSAGYKIAPLILIVFIENAFKHSQSGQSNNIEIDIQIRLQDNKMEFLCMNNYESSQASDNIAKGIGLENVKKRLQLLYPQRHILHIEEGENTYQVQLTLELEKMEQA